MFFILDKMAELYHFKQDADEPEYNITAAKANAKYLTEFWNQNPGAKFADLVHFCNCYDHKGDCTRSRNDDILIINSKKTFSDLCDCVDRNGMVPGCPKCGSVEYDIHNFDSLDYFQEIYCNFGFWARVHSSTYTYRNDYVTFKLIDETTVNAKITSEMLNHRSISDFGKFNTFENYTMLFAYKDPWGNTDTPGYYIDEFSCKYFEIMTGGARK